MLSAARKLLVPIVIVSIVAVAHVTFSISQLNRIERLNQEVATLKEEQKTTLMSLDMCNTLSTSMGGEIDVLKSTIDNLMLKEKDTREEYSSLKEEWEELKREDYDEACSNGEESGVENSPNVASPVRDLSVHARLLNKAYCSAGGTNGCESSDQPAGTR